MESDSLNSNTTITPSNPAAPANKGLERKLFIGLGLFVVLVVIALLSFYALQKTQAAKRSSAKIAELESRLQDTEKELKGVKESTGEENIDKDAFQAVFFKNGNVYFGKITKMTQSQITLENIYYLRADGGASTDIDNLSDDVSLVKLGNELHGPQDTMYIERTEVDFWENLKNDGQVAKAIAEYEQAN